MRLLAWLLLFFNVGMFAWILTQPQPAVREYRPIPVPPGVEPLVLLSERSPGVEVATVSDSPTTVAASAVETADTEVDAGGQRDAVAQQAVSESASGNTGGGAQVSADEGGAGQTGSGAETNALNDRSQADPATMMSGAEIGDDKEAICQTVGPLPEEADAEAIGTQLVAAGYQSQLRTGTGRKPSGYWVYMPAMPASQARRIVAELDAHGMKDYYIGKQNYISLGIFSRKDKALVRLDQINRLGFSALVEQRHRTGTVYWLDVEQGGEPLLASDVWGQLQQNYPDVRAQRVSCE